MPLDLDNILSDFEGKSKPIAKSKGLDLDSILAEFDSKPTDIKPEAAKKVLDNGYNLGNPEDRFKEDFGKGDKTNPRRSLPTTNIQESIVDAFNSGRATFSEGLNDLASNKPASGVGKTAMGALGTVFSPVTGLIEGGVATPIADITGSKRIGDAAGAVAGLGLPVVKGAGIVTGALPKNTSLAALVEHIGRENLPAAVAAMKANPRLGPADLSPKVLQSTQELFVNGGPAVNYLKTTSDARMAGSKNAIIDAYDTSGGVSPDLAGKVLELSNAAKKVGTDAIQPAIAGAKPVDVTNTMAEIDKILKPGVMNVVTSESGLPLTAVKKELAQIKAYLGNKDEMRTNADDLHKFQSGLRTTAESLMRSSTAADKELGKSLMNVRNNLVADIDVASGGKYKPALSKYRDEMHISDSFKEGYDGVFSGSKKMENDPSFTKKWFDGLTDHEKQAAREGARARIATEIGSARNPALAGESFARSDFNQDKLAVLFGKDEAAKLVKTLQEERTIADTHNKIVGGSQTAMRDSTKSEWKRPEKAELNNMVPYAAEALGAYTTGVPAVGAAAYQALKGVNSVVYKAKTAIAREREARYAQYALPTEGPSRDALIAALESQIPGPKPSLVTRGANALSRIVSP